MAESSARSSPGSASSGQGGAGYDGQGSPIPYRTGPLAYACEVKCGCKLKACRWISWSDGNPGRRYYRCPRAKTKDCGFYKWLDGECSDWYKEVLRDLRDTVWKLKKERNMGVPDEVVVADEVVDSAMEHGEEVEKMNLLLQKELLKKSAELDGKDKELQAKDQVLKEMEAKMKKKNWCLKVLVCVCVGLVILLFIMPGNVPWFAM